MRARRTGAGRLAAGAVAVLLTGFSLFAGSAGAATFDVTNTNDSGPGSLRQALADAATAAGPDTVAVQAGLGTITLASPIVWDGDGAVTIEGNGVTVDAGGASRGLVDDGGNGITVNGLNVTGVGGTTSFDAAPIVSEGGSVRVTDCVISGNVVDSSEGDAAGAVLSEGGAVQVDNCRITGNTASSAGDVAGGVLSEGGALTVSNSTISQNSGTTSDGDAGGGLLSEGGSVGVRETTITCNDATSEGADAAGGVLSEGGAVSIANSTVQANTATGETSENQILSNGPDPDIINSVVSDTGDCEVPTTSTTTTTGSTTTTEAGSTTSTTTVAAQPVAATATFTG